ncbi:hypothetical protein JVT61DRAFT_9119 [Boletus reticuloceps]|uniref:Uncharacterized protein n=1 Tax=Boletus reticuloceps TaxID=495285 RepID=A0A8I2YHC7_9AGAM|nr:hypothetical protein JVT61DRAFT_9119 [Boletus reticuloceps]
MGGHTLDIPLSMISLSNQPLEIFECPLGELSSHCSVLGYLLLSRSDQVSIIRHSGVVFEGEQRQKVRERRWKNRRERTGRIGGGQR